MSGSQIAKAIWLMGMDENVVRRSEAEMGHPQEDRAAMRRLPPEPTAQRRELKELVDVLGYLAGERNPKIAHPPHKHAVDRGRESRR